MKRNWTAACLAVSLLFVQGCIQDDIRVTVRPDGTGTIEERLLISNEVTGLLEGMPEGKETEDKGEKSAAAGETEAGAEREGAAGDSDGQAVRKAGKEKPDPAARMMRQAGKRAARFGPDVSLDSVVPDKTESATGYRAVYGFEDIRKIRIGKEQDREGSGPDDPAEQAVRQDDAIRFEFTGATAGAPALLTVRLPEQERQKAAKRGKREKRKNRESPPAGGDEAPPREPEDPKALEMMQTLFKGMRMTIAVRIEGAIVETNATWRDGGDIVLMDMDFERILENRDLVQEMAAGKPDSFADMKALFHGVKGLKFELQNPVLVRFK
jgi:hypothetical protein